MKISKAFPRRELKLEKFFFFFSFYAWDRKSPSIARENFHEVYITDSFYYSAFKRILGFDALLCYNWKLFQLNFQTFRLLLTIKQATNNKKSVLWTTDLKKILRFPNSKLPNFSIVARSPKKPVCYTFPRQKEVDLNRRRRRQKVSSYELSLSGPATFQPWNTPHLETFITSVDHRWLKAFPLEPRDERPRLFRECISFLPLFLHPLFALYLSRGWSSPPPNIHETVMKISRGGKRSVSKLFA